MSEDKEAIVQNPAQEKKQQSRSISRRTFAVGAVGSAAMLALGAVKFAPSEAICRPPGAQDENAFLSACIHCEKCREVCHAHAIKPAKLESGILSLRTPQMDYRSGWCDFCESTDDGVLKCVAVCPVGAFSLPEGKASENVVIGVAEINPSWCLAYTAMGCHECADACPYDAMFVDDSGIPRVLAEQCNGCGACEFACISLSSGSIAANATDRAIVVRPVKK